MQKLFVIALFSCLSFTAFAQSISDETAIRELLDRQNQHWNNGNIEAFMDDYWQSDSLMFIGKSGIVYGWQATKDRYLKNYPNRQTMGQLAFDIKKIDLLSPTAAWVLGKWQLTRPEVGDVGGYFTLMFKKINGRWVIVSDHTS